MKWKNFKAAVLSGHKDDAVEVPFDPAAEWGIAPTKLWRGRHGHFVDASINGIPFESAIVPRQKRFYLLIDEATRASASVRVGAVASITIKPSMASKNVVSSSTSKSKQGRRPSKGK